MSTDIPAIACRELSKSYGNFRALDGLTLEVRPGEIFGFLGPNGAGKTTAIRLLMGMLIPTRGSATIFGLDCLKDRAEAKRRVGYLPDTPAFQDYLRGSEILEFVASMHGIPEDEREERVDALVRRFDLLEAADEFAVNYSTGMKRRLALACAQVHDPDLFVLDEPTNGLDPIVSRDVQDWIVSAAERGKTVFLSTHLLEMAERLCHRVGIVDRGRLLAVGAPHELEATLCPGGSLEDAFFAVTQGGTRGA